MDSQGLRLKLAKLTRARLSSGPKKSLCRKYPKATHQCQSFVLMENFAFVPPKVILSGSVSKLNPAVS